MGEGDFDDISTDNTSAVNTSVDNICLSESLKENVAIIEMMIPTTKTQRVERYKNMFFCCFSFPLRHSITFFLSASITRRARFCASFKVSFFPGADFGSIDSSQSYDDGWFIVTTIAFRARSRSASLLLKVLTFIIQVLSFLVVYVVVTLLQQTRKTVQGVKQIRSGRQTNSKPNEANRKCDDRGKPQKLVWRATSDINQILMADGLPVTSCNELGTQSDSS